MPDERFSRSLRIRHQADFNRVFQHEAFASDPVLVVRGCPNALPHPRLGLSVSRKVGNAVVRNRWKRLIREAFRRQQHDLPAGYDFVFRPRRGAEPEFAAIFASLPRLCRQLVQRLERERR